MKNKTTKDRKTKDSGHEASPHDTRQPAAPARKGPGSRLAQALTSWCKDRDKVYTVLSVAVFAVMAYTLLAVCYPTYMTKIESLTLYIGTPLFYDQCMTVPGGGINWLSAWLTQYLHNPYTGALVITVLLGAIQVAAIKAFRMPARKAPLAVILPALVLLAFTNLGYLIFTLKPNGFALSLPLGILAALLVFLLFSRLRAWWLQSLAVVAVTALLYHLLGFYALLAATMCGVSTILGNRGGHPLTRFVPFAMSVAAVCVTPMLWYNMVGGELMPAHMYMSGLPRFFEHETGIKVLYSLVFVVAGAGAFFAPVMRGGKGQEGHRWPVAVCLLAMACVPVMRYADRDFFTTLELDKALWDQDWPRAAEIAKEMEGPTTRVNTALAYVALMRNGEAGDRMFAIAYGWEPYNTTRGGSAFNDAASYLLCYHLGLPNYAFRWATEYSIAQSMSPERMKMMAKCALLNYDLALAKTYLDLLYNMPNHREWARKYMQYQKNPMEMGNDPEFAMIRPLMCHDNAFINDGGAIEGYVWPLLAGAGEGTPQFTELEMQAALICRDLDAFVSRLPLYLAWHNSMPIHYQEAALLWAKLNNAPYPGPVSPQVEDRHGAFLSAFKNTSAMEAENQRESMRDQFDNTYWFYFVFNDDKIIK